MCVENAEGGAEANAQYGYANAVISSNLATYCNFNETSCAAARVTALPFYHYCMQADDPWLYGVAVRTVGVDMALCYSEIEKLPRLSSREASEE